MLQIPTFLLFFFFCGITLFPMFIWLTVSLNRCLCANVTFSVKLTLSILSKIMSSHTTYSTLFPRFFFLIFFTNTFSCIFIMCLVFVFPTKMQTLLGQRIFVCLFVSTSLVPRACPAQES